MVQVLGESSWVSSPDRSAGLIADSHEPACLRDKRGGGCERGSMTRNQFRRLFLKNSAMATSISVAGSRIASNPSQASVIVVGADAFDGWPALELLRMSARVRLIDD